MTTLDLLLLLAIVLSAVAGYRMGFLVRAAGVGGVVLGLVLGLAAVPVASELLQPRSVAASLVLTAVAAVVGIVLATVLLQAVALRLRGAIADTGWRPVDGVAGAVVGVLGALVLVWFAAPLAATLPGEIARQVRSSSVVATVDELAPDVASPLGVLQALLADTRFPEVFAGLAPTPATGPPPGSLALDEAALAAARAGAVKIEVVGCDVAFTGSGWAVEDDLVVTNAHVVAGADGVLVRRADGRRLEGEVVVFDDDRDLALVRVPDLDVRPLPRGTAEDGEEAAVLGHPLGQEQPRIAAARVERTIPALGRDIYGLDRTERQVVVVAADLRQGDSGGPLVDAEGQVVGTVFAISPETRGTAYALADEELAAVLAAPRRPGHAGACT